jgi:hypothetical protein
MSAFVATRPKAKLSSPIREADISQTHRAGPLQTKSGNWHVFYYCCYQRLGWGMQDRQVYMDGGQIPIRETKRNENERG